jgi:thymidylate synthase (FAD)
MKLTEQSVELIDYMGSDVNIVNAARVSFAKEVKEFNLNTDTRLLNYLAKHNHWSPFAHTCISVRCKVPLFIARQLVKHQVGGNWNEESRRYIDSEPEFWLPKELHMRPQNAKQGASGVHPNSSEWLYVMKEQCKRDLQLYSDMVKANVAPEEARMVLPLNTMTNYIWTGSLLFFRRVIAQREDAHAQLAAQEFAHKLKLVVRPVYQHGYLALENAYA